MTKLADELEALAKDATPGKWPDALAGSVGSSAHMANFDLCNLMCSSDNLATIIAALRQPDAEKIILPIIDQHGNTIGTAERTPEEHGIVEAFVDDHDTAWMPPTAWAYFKRCQPDAVPGDLVETAWLGLKARVCSDPSKATRCVMVSRNDLAAAIQSLTTENALCKQQIGVFTEAFDGLKAERDAALARVAALEAGLAAINAGALNDRENDKNFRYFAERKTRALLEGSKP